MKKLISVAPVLAYYQSVEQPEIQCNSSQSRLGAALIQNGQPIAYASRAFTKTKSRCVQIEKEMLAVVVAVEAFNDYTFGRKTMVHTNHKPLESILKKPLYRAPKRLPEMILCLQKYNVEVRHLSGKQCCKQTPFPRAYAPGTGSQKESVFETINMLMYLPISKERLLQIQQKNRK